MKSPKKLSSTISHFSPQKRFVLSLPAGFTLIELLVVIAILAVLAGMVLLIINPGKRIASSKDANVKSDITTLAVALQGYYTAQASTQYTTTLDGLVTSGELKSVPKQQSGNITCPAAAAGSTLNVSGTAGTTGYYYCYYTVTVSGAVTSVAVMGSLFNVASNTWHCWDSNTGAYKSSTTAAPTVASSQLSC